MINLGQIRDPGVNIVLAYGLKSVTVHMIFSLPLGNSDSG